MDSSTSPTDSPSPLVEMSQLINNFAQNEPIFDNELLYPSPKQSEITKLDGTVLKQATIESLVTYLTSPEIIDYQFMVDFFLSFRKFIDPLPLLELLLCRFTWALKRSSSDEPATADTGKLALVRTFVTLRHWLLNHFQDDFLNDAQMRDLLASTINEIPNHPVFMGCEPLAGKVVVNLKKSYLVLCHIYWNTVSLDKLANVDLLHYPIKSYETMPHSRLSVLGFRQLRDPSYRRSGILSMVERTSAGSMTVMMKDHNNGNNNSNNNRLQRKQRKPEDRFILHPKASLISLGQNNLKSINREGTLENIYSNMLQHVKSTPVQGVKELTELRPRIEYVENVGFSLSGAVPVFQDSRISTIAPGTPLKKLNSRVREPLSERKQNAQQHVPAEKRKSFFRSLWSRDDTATQRKRLVSGKTASPSGNVRGSGGSATAAKKTATPVEQTIDTTNKLDLLSKRIIEEYKVVETETQQAKDLIPDESISMPATSSPMNVGGSGSGGGSADGSNKNDSSLDSSRLLAQFNDPADAPNASFRTPSVTMNWSNSLDISSASKDIVDMGADQYGEKQEDISEDTPVKEIELKDMSICDTTEEPKTENILEGMTGDDEAGPDDAEVETQDVLTDIDSTRGSQADSNGSATKHTASRPTKVFSLPARKPAPLTFRPLSVPAAANLAQEEDDDVDAMKFDEPPLEDDIISEERPFEAPIDCSSMIDHNRDSLNGRVSIAMISQGADSTKSYMTYDSDISSSAYSDEDRATDVQLRKKTGFTDLRQGAIQVEPVDYDDVISALKELPFYEEGFKSRSDSTVDSESTVSMISSPPQSCLLPYPGISQTAIDELAAIPDEKISCNPIDYARNKLCGESRPSSHISVEMQSMDTRSSIHTVDEMRLERKVRDLFIANPNQNETETDTDTETETEMEIENNANENANENANVQEEEEEEEEEEDIDTSVASAEEKSAVECSTPLRAKYNSRLLRNDMQRSSSFDMNSLSLTPSKCMDDSPLLSVQEAMYKGNHLPFMLSYDADVLSQQMTLIERDLLLEIDWKEFMDLKWDKPLEPHSSWLNVMADAREKTRLQVVTLRFNLVTNWIISEVLLCKEVSVRALTLSRFIHLAMACKRLQNYATMFQISLALTSPMVKSLKSTWNRLDAGDLLVFKEVKDITSSTNDFQSIRNEMENVVPSKGVIPFLALELSDLNQNAERPNIIEAVEEERQGGGEGRGEEDDDEEEEEEEEAYELVNFDKFRTACRILKTILRQTDWSKLYHLRRNDSALSKCLYISSLSQEEMAYCLEHLEN